MSQPRRSLAPDAESAALADQILSNAEIHREIIAETLRAEETGSIRESGRTICPAVGKALDPTKRFPTSVKLASCPVSRGGIVHTHVTPDEIRRPQNSLPDIANVVYGLTDVSAVVGTQRAEAVMRSADPNSMKRSFESALGVDVSGPQEVYETIIAGEVNPSRAQRAVRSELSPLFTSIEVDYTDLERQAKQISAGESIQSIEVHEATAFQSITTRESRGYQPAGSIQRAGEKIGSAVENGGGGGDSGLSLRDLVLSQALGTIVGTVVSAGLDRLTR